MPARRSGRADGVVLVLLGAAVAIVLALVATGVIARWLLERRDASRGSAERAARDADLVSSARGWLARTRLGESLHGTPALRDKLLALDDAARRVDPTQVRIPSDRAARRADQIGTLLLVRRGSARVGRLPGGREELVRTAEVTIVDVVEATIIGRRTFRGARASAAERDEAARSGGSGDLLGPELHVLVADWIAALPQK